MASQPSSASSHLAAEGNMLPVVARARNGAPVWAIVLVVLVLAVILFAVLDSRRRALTAPAVRPRATDAISTGALPTPLFVPPEYVPPPSPVAAVVPGPAVSPPSPPVSRPAPAPAPVYIQQQLAEPAGITRPPPPRMTGEPALVIDTTSPAAAGGAGSTASSDETSPAQARVAGNRAGAGVLANRATTVPQGTLIPAVLETALDSTRPGLARAIVSRDVRGFDGSRVLIPRGSRLIGEYGAQNEAGQNRMLVNWLRLVRPDGVTISIGSPASDPLGRAGVRARVNSHFFERFAGAILQSGLDLGVNLASRSANSPVIVALPGAVQGTTARVGSSNEIQPTLTVRAATSISIFVARDLDFTSVEGR